MWYTAMFDKSDGTKKIELSLILTESFLSHSAEIVRSKKNSKCSGGSYSAKSENSYNKKRA